MDSDRVVPEAPETPFPPDELAWRCRDVQAEMGREGVDLLIADQPEMIAYLCGYAMSEGMPQYCLLPADGPPTIVIRRVDAGTCEAFARVREVVGYSDWEDPIGVVAALVEARGWPAGTVGVDYNSYSMTLLRFEALRRAFPGAAFHDLSTSLAARRACKSGREVDCILQAARIADNAFTALLQEIAPGDRIRDCAARISDRVIRLGGDAGVVGPIARNIDDRKMHAPIKEERVEEGDVLHVELIPQYAGYASRLMRPVSIGPVAPEVAVTAKEIVLLQDRQLEAMVPGARACDVDAVLRSAMLDGGLKSTYTNITGYSLGYYQLHTARSSDFSYVFRPGEKWRLRAGMVFHMYTVAKGLAFSETVCITDNGPERLTRTERAVLSVPVGRNG